MQNNITVARIHLFSILGSFYINQALNKDYDYIKSVLEAIANEPFVEEAKDIATQMLDFMNTKKEEILNEYEVLFNLPFGDFIHSSVSYYYDERELGIQTILAKEIMCEAGYIKANFYSLGEDEYGLLCALCAKLLQDGKYELEKKAFEHLVKPYVSKFLEAQLKSQRAEFYKLVASLFAIVVAFESSYFEYYN